MLIGAAPVGASSVLILVQRHGGQRQRLSRRRHHVMRVDPLIGTSEKHGGYIIAKAHAFRQFCRLQTGQTLGGTGRRGYQR